MDSRAPSSRMPQLRTVRIATQTRPRVPPSRLTSLGATSATPTRVSVRRSSALRTSHAVRCRRRVPQRCGGACYPRVASATGLLLAGRRNLGRLVAPDAPLRHVLPPWEHLPRPVTPTVLENEREQLLQVAVLHGRDAAQERLGVRHTNPQQAYVRVRRESLVQRRAALSRLERQSRSGTRRNEIVRNPGGMGFGHECVASRSAAGLRRGDAFNGSEGGFEELGRKVLRASRWPLE